jgi:hypothetical protein
VFGLSRSLVFALVTSPIKFSSHCCAKHAMMRHHRLCLLYCLQVVKMLIAAGADVNAPRTMSHRGTPLMSLLLRFWTQHGFR